MPDVSFLLSLFQLIKKTKRRFYLSTTTIILYSSIYSNVSYQVNTSICLKPAESEIVSEISKLNVDITHFSQVAILHNECGDEVMKRNLEIFCLKIYTPQISQPDR